MNLKNLILGSLAGFAVNMFLGWVFYVKLFPHLHPSSETTNMLFIALGAFFFALMLAYIFIQWTHISDWMTGLKAGAIISAINSLSMLFYMYSNMPMDTTNFVEEFVASIVSGGLTGAAIAVVIGKLNASKA